MWSGILLNPLECQEQYAYATNDDRINTLAHHLAYDNGTTRGPTVFNMRRVVAYHHIALGDIPKQPIFRRWPYRIEYTGSLLTSEVERRKARLVLGWGAAREDLRVLSAFVF